MGLSDGAVSFSHDVTLMWAVANYGRPLDTLVAFETASVGSAGNPPVRYAVRQVLDQEYQKNIVVREHAARQARYLSGNGNDVNETSSKKEEILDGKTSVKRDFFGRVIKETTGPLLEIDANRVRDEKRPGKERSKDEDRVWVTFHEGYSNAVKKPITVEELMRGL